MTLALMPGSEPISVPVPEPQIAQPEIQFSGNPWQSGGRLSGVGGAVQGCECASCHRMRSNYREQQQRRAVMSAQYGGFGHGADVLVVDEASEYPQGMPPGMIRGRYDMSQSGDPNAGFHGQVRWRMPGTREVYDSDGRRQWTYNEEMPDGTLVDTRNRRWVPDSARQDVYAGIATAMQQVAAAPPVFDWDNRFNPDSIFRRSP